MNKYYRSKIYKTFRALTYSLTIVVIVTIIFIIAMKIMGIEIWDWYYT